MHLKGEFLCRLQLFLFCVLRVAETLLEGSKFHRYIRDGLSQVRSSAPYSVPDDVHQHLDFGESLSVAVNILQQAVWYIVIVGFKITLIFVPPQLEEFIASLQKGKRMSVKPLSTVSLLSPRLEYIWE